MDGNLQAAEARVAGQWKTVLAGGMGQGAKGVFALDVTTPEQFMAGQRQLFEFTENDDPDIGYITAPPIITKINLKKTKKGPVTENYFVLVTSGYQSANPQGEQFLFLLSLDKSPTTSWSQNKNYYKVRMKAGPSDNALSAPGLVFNPEGAAIYAYSGDLQGNLWRFDLNNLSPGNLATISPKIIFSAQDQRYRPQAITAQPVVAFAADRGYLILFGTGNPEDNMQQQNSFYAIHDVVSTQAPMMNRSQLVARELKPDELKLKTNAYKISGKNFSYGKTHPDKRGWYVDYPKYAEHCNERSISEGMLAYGAVFFNTLQTCTSGSNKIHTSRSYKLNVMTGKLDSADQLTGFSSSTSGKPVLLTTPIVTANKDVFGRRHNTQQYSVLNFAQTEPTKATLKAGRLSWREIVNWRDIKNQ
jgi:type IV pilus assembly protein PilY1